MLNFSPKLYCTSDSGAEDLWILKSVYVETLGCPASRTIDMHKSRLRDFRAVRFDFGFSGRELVAARQSFVCNVKGKQIQYNGIGCKNYRDTRYSTQHEIWKVTTERRLGIKAAISGGVLSKLLLNKSPH